MREANWSMKNKKHPAIKKFTGLLLKKDDNENLFARRPVNRISPILILLTALNEKIIPAKKKR
jgi:hypothetical protein